MVDTSDIMNLKSTLIKQTNEINFEKFCLLNELLDYKTVNKSSVSEVQSGSIERKFVDYCFHETIGTGERVTRVDKVKNKSV